MTISFCPSPALLTCARMYACFSLHITFFAMNSPTHLVLSCRGISSPSEDDWDMAKSLGIRDVIEFREDVPIDELASLYRNAALFVLPSNEEGLGIVLLEAMASGTPVVSTRCGGPETIIVDGETGFLTPVGDAQALAARMRQLLESPQLRRDMGASGRRTIKARFSLDVAGRAFLDKYVEILSRRG